MSRLSNQIYRVANLDITIFLTKPKTERKLPNKQGRASRRPNKEARGRFFLRSRAQARCLLRIFEPSVLFRSQTERHLKAMEEYEAFEGLNESTSAAETSDSDLNTSHCGHLDMDKYSTIQSCTFWVEGIAMSILGFGAIITNIISIYVFSK